MYPDPASHLGTSADFATPIFGEVHHLMVYGFNSAMNLSRRLGVHARSSLSIGASASDAAGASHTESSSSFSNLGNDGSGLNLKPTGSPDAGPLGSLGSAGPATALAARRLRIYSGSGPEEEDGASGTSSRFRSSSGSCSSGTRPLEELSPG